VRRHMRSQRSRALSLPQFRTLALLRAVPSAHLSMVAEFLGSSLPTASRMVSGLVAKGLIARRESTGDRRHIELALTPRGAAAIESARRVTRDKLAGELHSLNESERRGLLRAMQLLYDIFSRPLNPNDAAADQTGERAGSEAVSLNR